MTEQEWLTCTVPGRMLELLRDTASDRNLRLFACACCRQEWHLIVDERSRKAVGVAERYTDGLTSRPELDAMREAAWDVWKVAETDAARIVAWHAEEAVAGNIAKAATRIARREDIAWAVQSSLLRDIFGNPFRPYPKPPSWSSTVVQLAESLYQGNNDCRLPLSDALEEAGHVELADHFRKEEWHPKGCWVVDLVLGKE
jgi:hypothetical protein